MSADPVLPLRDDAVDGLAVDPAQDRAEDQTGSRPGLLGADLVVDTATRRPGGRTARVRELVLAATLDELAACGYAALRVESVAERAGVNKTTIYRRWGSKSRLVAAAVITAQGEMVPVPDTGSLRTDVFTLLSEVRNALRTPWVSALASEIGPRRTSEDDVHLVLDQLWPERFRLSRQVFERAIARGELPAEADPDLLLEALSGPLYFRWLMLGKPLTDAFLGSIADLVLDGARTAPETLRSSPASAPVPAPARAARRPIARRPIGRRTADG